MRKKGFLPPIKDDAAPLSIRGKVKLAPEDREITDILKRLKRLNSSDKGNFITVRRLSKINRTPKEPPVDAVFDNGRRYRPGFDNSRRTQGPKYIYLPKLGDSLDPSGPKVNLYFLTYS